MKVPAHISSMLLLALLVVLGSAPSCKRTSDEMIASEREIIVRYQELERRLQELRDSGRHEEALAVAKEELALVSTSQGAEKLVAALEKQIRILEGIVETKQNIEATVNSQLRQLEANSAGDRIAAARVLGKILEEKHLDFRAEEVRAALLKAAESDPESAVRASARAALGMDPESPPRKDINSHDSDTYPKPVSPLKIHDDKVSTRAT